MRGRAARRRDTDRHRQLRSRSIPHDHVPHVTDAKYRSFSLVVDPPRRRSRKCKLAISTSAPICIAQGRYLLSQSSQRAPHDRQRRRPTRSMPSLAITHLACRTQIPIGPAAPPRPTSHGFLVWGLCCQAVSERRLSFLLAFLIGFFVRPGIPFLRPDPQYCKASARRSCQGWPSRRSCGILRPCQATP